MKKIYDLELLYDYLSRGEIDRFFSKNLLSYFELFTFEKDTFIIKEGFCSDYLYFMTGGKAKIYAHSPSGNMMLLGFCEPFQLIGESASLWGKEAIASVKALSDGHCIGISLTKYRHLLLKDVTFLRHTCEILANKLSISNGVFGNVFLHPIENRLAFYMLHTASDGIFSDNLTECAELLSTSYRHLLRVLGQLCASAIIEKRGKDYLIKDYDALKKMTHPLDES